VRLLYLLTELGHLAFADVEEPVAAQERRRRSLLLNRHPPPGCAAARAAQDSRSLRRPPPPRPRPAPPPVMRAAPTPETAGGCPKAAAPVLSRPPPTFAQGPENESPDAALTVFQRSGSGWPKPTISRCWAWIGRPATPAETKRNFFVLAKELHPDTVTDTTLTDLKEVKERLFARINEAAQVLGDDKHRKEYESELDGKAENVDVSRIFAAEENFQKAEIFIKARKYQEGWICSSRPSR